jgi:hypothetical protein
MSRRFSIGDDFEAFSLKDVRPHWSLDIELNTERNKKRPLNRVAVFVNAFAIES